MLCRKGWVTKHSCPLDLLSDQYKEAMWMELVFEICQRFNIEKRRTSGYHSQGNGFAERNIRSIREIRRTLLAEKGLPQSYWRNILTFVIFSLNCAESTSNKCIPFEVIYGRCPTLSCDIIPMIIHQPSI